MTFGEKIQKLRKQQGLSQEALAEKVTVTRQTISKWELDQSTPDLEFIARLSSIFGVSADYLIREELVEPNALPFQKKKEVHLTERVKRHILVVLSAVALIAICVCLICPPFWGLSSAPWVCRSQGSSRWHEQTVWTSWPGGCTRCLRRCS